MASISEPIALAGDQLVAWRQRHLIREAAIRSVGTLHYLLAALGWVAAMSAIFNGNPTWPLIASAGAVFAVFGSWVGWGLRRLDPRSRSLAAAGAFAGLWIVPFGTVMGLLVLYLLYSPTSQTIFEAHYRQHALQSLCASYAWSWLFSVLWLAYLTAAAGAMVAIPWILPKLPGNFPL